MKLRNYLKNLMHGLRQERKAEYLSAEDVTELRKVEERYRTLFDNAPILIDAFDVNGKCVLWNRECEKVFGWKKDEINEHENTLALFYPDPDVQKEVIETVISKPAAIFREWHPITKDGKTLTMMWANFTLPDGLVINLGYDITERKMMEEELRKSEHEKALVLDNTDEIIAFHDTDHRILWANRSYLNSIGVTLSEIRGKKCYEAWGLDRPCNGCPVTEAMETDKPQSSELTPENQPHWPADQGSWMSRAAPVKDDSGNIIGAIEVAYNITEQKRVEKERENLVVELQAKSKELMAANEMLETANEELQVNGEELESTNEELQVANEELQTRSEELESTNEELQVTNEELDQTSKELQASKSDLEVKVVERTRELRDASAVVEQLFESTASGIVMINKSYDITDCNEPAARLLKTDKGTMIGKKCYDVMWEKCCQTDDCPMKRILSGEDILTKDIVKRRPDGTTFPCIVQAKPFVDGDGNAVGIVEDIRDVTDIKAMEEKLIQSERLSILGRLSGSVSHELRNPLAIIKNASYYLTKKAADLSSEEMMKHLGIIERQTETADTIINNILDFAKPHNIEPKDVWLNSVIDKAIEESSIPASVKIVKENKEDIYLSIDPVQMQQVFVNILSNSLRAVGDEGSIEIATKRGMGKNVIIAISDDGAGMSKEDLEKVFEPLFSRATKGIGFGMTIVKDIVERHDGKIVVESEPGKGTTVTVNLPLNEPNKKA